MPKARRVSTQGCELLPTVERLGHGPIERLLVPIEDTAGQWSRPLIGLDTLARMERAGTIGEAEARAGSRFHDQFRSAHLDNLFAADTTRIPVVLANGNNRNGHDANEGARLSVLSALDALGGPQSPGGSCAWHVLGCELSIQQWALRIGWGDRRRLHNLTATGILLTDLAILRAHYGL
jgi:hypothetical protein